MTLSCTVATVVHLLGYMPANGEVVVVPKSRANEYSRVQQIAAKVCARRLKFQVKVDPNG